MALCRRFLGIFVRLEVDDKPVVTQEVLTGRRSFFHHAKKYSHRVKRKKTAHIDVFLFLDRKPLPYSPKLVIDPYKGFFRHS
jgi:hypothetical protein